MSIPFPIELISFVLFGGLTFWFFDTILSLFK